MSGLIETTKGAANELVTRGQTLLDSTFPPEKRTAVQSRIQEFAAAYPRLATFLLANVLLSGVPFITFVTFSLSVFIFSLLTALILGTLFTVVVTVWAVGFALLFFLPVVFLTTLAATFLWVWGMAAYFVFQYFNREDRKQAINEKIQSITGGKMNGTATDKKNSEQHSLSNGQEKSIKSLDNSSATSTSLKMPADTMNGRFTYDTPLNESADTAGEDMPSHARLVSAPGGYVSPSGGPIDVYG